MSKKERKKKKAERRAEGARWDAKEKRKTIKNLRAQFGLQPVIIVVAAAAALMIMTWLIRDVLDVRHIYAAA